MNLAQLIDKKKLRQAVQQSQAVQPEGSIPGLSPFPNAPDYMGKLGSRTCPLPKDAAASVVQITGLVHERNLYAAALTRIAAALEKEDLATIKAILAEVERAIGS